jgi:hypothetical protein
VWQGRKLDFLHLYHHATTFALFLIVMNFPGTEKFGMILNGFVHTIMVRGRGRGPCGDTPLFTGGFAVLS